MATTKHATATLDFELTGVKELLANVTRVNGDMKKAGGAALYTEGEKIMKESKEEVPVNLGVLRASGRVQLPEYTDTSVSVTLSYGGAAGKYAVYVHEGFGPAVGKAAFMPPSAPFAAWAKRVLGDESLGFVIARSVGMKGVKATKYLEHAMLAAAFTGLDDRIAESIKRAVGA